jgi:hypothetical protein
MRHALREERGQAVTELALCSAVFVLLLSFGIYFGELGYLSLKAHEGAAHALWDSTGYRVHELSVAGSFDAQPAATSASAQASRLYGSYQGLTSETGGAPPVLVATQASGPMTVTCRREPTLAYGAPRGMVPGSPGLGVPGASEPNGVSCYAQGAVSPVGLSGVPGSLTVCGVGKAAGGSCANDAMGVLLGDFALAVGTSKTENQECAVEATDRPAVGAQCANQHFYDLVHSAWYANMGWTGVPESWADHVDWPPWFSMHLPPNGEHVTGFYMSFRGEDPHAPGGWNTETIADGSSWQTSPMDVPPEAPAGVGPGAYGTYREAYSQTGALPATRAWPSTPKGRALCASAHGYCYLGRFPCD